MSHDFCLDCREVHPRFCDTCAMATEDKRLAYNTYQREYQKQMRQNPIQRPKVLASQRERSRRYRERHAKRDDTP